MVTGIMIAVSLVVFGFTDLILEQLERDIENYQVKDEIEQDLKEGNEKTNETLNYEKETEEFFEKFKDE